MTTVRLPKNLEHKLDQYALMEQKTKSAIIKKALEQYFQGHDLTAAPYLLGEDLFGRHESCREDLSTTYKAKVKEKVRAKHAD